MPGLCSIHGPYDGLACPYPPPHSENLSNEAQPITLSENDDITTTTFSRRPKRVLDDLDDDVTAYDQSTYDEMDRTELEAPEATTFLAMLWIKEGRRIGKTYAIRDGTVIGSKFGDIILDDIEVSSHHAKFKKDGDKFIVWDLASTFGTYLNGKKIRSATVLEENDLIQIGETIFVVKLLSSVLKPKKKIKDASKKKIQKK